MVFIDAHFQKSENIKCLNPLMVKVLFGGANKKSLDRSDVSLLKIATRADPNLLEKMNIVKRGKDREYMLVEQEKLMDMLQIGLKAAWTKGAGR